MINVGVIGLGMMGRTHLDVYAKRRDVKVVALADVNPKRLSGEERAGGNIEGQAQGGSDFADAKRHAEAMQLIADDNVQVVDVCVPTPLHAKVAIAALEAGKHVLVEKPVVRHHAEAQALVAAAEKAKGLAMCAMCMRFWPGWDWLKRAVADGTYGKVRAAHFRRVTSHPGGSFYSDGDACGGAILDLHVHDTDFIKYCFGTPAAVTSRGYSSATNKVDHVVTQYHYDDVPLVHAEGGWAMADGYGFDMQYTVNFERATASFHFDGKNHVRLVEPGKPAQDVAVEDAMGYEREIAYFLDCVARGEKPSRVTLADAAESIRIVEAEAESVRTGAAVRL